MIIYGAGLAGLLAGNMLRRYKPVIYEKQLQLPNNHSALLRFRSDAVARATGIPFKKVRVTKAVYYAGALHNVATLAMANLYAFKVTGTYSQRSLSSLEPVERYIAPPDFIAQLSQGLEIRYGKALERSSLIIWPSGPVISTIPMPNLMAIAGVSEPDFQYRPIWTLTAVIPNCDLYQTIYYPELGTPYYRASITGNLLTVEFQELAKLNEHQMLEVLGDFEINLGYGALAILPGGHQPFGKLLPLADDSARRRFIVSMTDQHNIYALGRFATWRQILLDDVVNDVHRIDAWISDRQSNYKRKLES